MCCAGSLCWSLKVLWGWTQGQGRLLPENCSVSLFKLTHDMFLHPIPWLIPGAVAAGFSCSAKQGHGCKPCFIPAQSFQHHHHIFVLLPFAEAPWCESPVPAPRRVEDYPRFGPPELDGDISSLCRAWSHCPAPLLAHNPFIVCGHTSLSQHYLFSMFLPPSKLVIYHQSVFLFNVFEVYILAFLLLPVFAG